MAKSQKVIFAHSLVNSMGAIGDRALAPMFLHPLQHGGRNLGKAYSVAVTETVRSQYEYSGIIKCL